MANEVSNGLHNAVAYHWEYADAAARTAATGFTSDDLGKWARQDDTDTLWMLTATAPTWVAVGVVLTPTRIPFAASTGVLTSNAGFTRDANGTVGNILTGTGAPAIFGQGDTGYGGDFEATGAGGWGVYAYASGAGGQGLVAEVGATDGIPLQGLAPTSQTAALLDLQVNSVTKFAVAASGRPRFVSTPPSSASDTGTAGELAWDSGFLYICTATNTWKRVAVATW